MDFGVEQASLSSDAQAAFEVTVHRYLELLYELLNKPRHPFADGLYAALPAIGGVYRISEIGSESSTTIYIGQSNNLRRRIYRNHLMGSGSNSTLRRKLIASSKCQDEADVKCYLKEKCWVQVVQIPDTLEQMAFEHFAAALLKPTYND
jgi:hypothetical protein